MIEANGLTKRYGDTVAVSDLSFTVHPGVVTGFLGPNGSGKSTTMRMIIGLDAPTGGTVTVDGRRYADHPAPLRDVGALLEARAIHVGRSGYDHLLSLAVTTGIGRRRVEEVIELVGLAGVARKRTGSFSLGMWQRLGVAAALLGDPATLVLDEPVNGLDPEGILWIRTLLKNLAAEGRTVLVSSHLMSEMALTAEHLIVIGRGQLIADLSVEELTSRASRDLARVRSPQAAQLRDLLAGPSVTISSTEAGQLEVIGLSTEEIGSRAAEAGVVLHELTHVRASLEEAFMDVTRGAVDYHGSTGPAPTGSPKPSATEGNAA